MSETKKRNIFRRSIREVDYVSSVDIRKKESAESWLEAKKYASLTELTLALDDIRSNLKIDTVVKKYRLIGLKKLILVLENYCTLTENLDAFQTQTRITAAKKMERKCKRLLGDIDTTTNEVREFLYLRGFDTPFNNSAVIARLRTECTDWLTKNEKQ